MKLFGGVISITGVTFFMFSIFIIIALGFALGRIKIKGISLGDAGVFIMALLFGCLFFDRLDAQFVMKFTDSTGTEVVKHFTSQALKVIESFGLILFVTSVGFTAGPKFFSNLRKNFKSYVVLALIVILAGAAATVGCILFGRLPFMGEEDSKELTAMVVGILSGSLTSTPAFSAALDTVATLSKDELVVAEYRNAVTVGHGIAYIFGVLGVVLFVQLIPKLTKANMDEERAKLTGASGKKESNRSIKRRMKAEKKNQTEEPKKPKLLDIDSHGFAAFAIAAIVGVFVGAIKIPVTSRFTFTLTTTGGCLLTSLILGHFSRIGKVNIMPKDSTLKIFKELGLILFLVGAGIAGGAEFLELFRPIYFVYGMIITIVPMVAGYFFAKYVLKLSLLNNLGSLTGAMTSTPALGTLIGVAKTDDVASAYAATYPIALITVVLSSQLIIMFM